MNATQVETQAAVENTGLEVQTMVRWGVLIFIVGYIAVSLYLIIDTRSRLASVTAA